MNPNELIDGIPEWRRKGLVYTDANRSGFCGRAYLHDDGTINVQGYSNYFGQFFVFYMTDQDGKITGLC